MNRAPRSLAAAVMGCLLTASAGAQGVVTVFGDVSWGQGDIPAGLTDVTHVGACRRTVAAVRSDGTIIAWGYDANGEVSNVPAPPAGHRFDKVFGGWGLTLFGLLDDGRLLSWGRNSMGQADVAALPAGRRYVRAAAGYFLGGGLRDDGSIVMWGAYEPTFNAAQRVQLLSVPYISPSLRWQDFGIGYDYTLALRSDGQIIGWGLDYWYGTSFIPALPTGMHYTTMSHAGTFAVALRSDGALVSWGDDFFGQVGDAPAEPSEGAQWAGVHAGADHAFAVDSSGAWFGWGTNFDGESDASLVPTQVMQFLAVGDTNVVLHAPDCFGDLDASGEVDAGDVAFVLFDFGVCPGCPGDLDGSGEVDSGDVALVLLSMGPCG